MTEPETTDHGQPHRFDYTPRRATMLGRGYSQFVSVLKFSLPLAAIVIVGLLVSRLSSHSTLQTTSDVPAAEKTTPGQIELVQARYEGTDGEGRPYTITADKAVRANSAPDAVSFDNPVADITMTDKSWVAVKGKSGVFDHAKETLMLQNDVSVFHDSGYEMHLADLEINLRQKTAKSTQPLTAQGPMGTVTAQNVTVEDQGNLVIFGGPATMTIFKLSGGKQRG